MPTIIQVAAAAGVSTATVSRVLSRPNQVSDATRRRVLEVVDTLGYKPNVAARTLRTLRAARILVLVPDISNPFFASVIRGAEEAARDAGYAVIVGDTRHDPQIEDQYADMLSGREVDGLIFLGHRLPDNLQDLVSRHGGRAPIVNGCDYSPDLGVPSVHIDNLAAGRDALEHLIGLGHRDIAVIMGTPASPLNRDRLAGAREAAKRHGIDDRLQVRVGDYSAQSAFDLTGDLIARGATALFCFSDEMAMGAISAIHHAGLGCPDDISVVGFDDLPSARFLQPALTTIAQPKELIGRHTVEQLLGILSDADYRAGQIILPHELVVRCSTGSSGGPR